MKTKFQSSDILSGFIVFLIALPLSLGIALASGVPPMAGLIAAMIGGIFVSKMGSSQITINGPAAGLIVVVVYAVETLGQGDALAGYQAMLLAVFLSGIVLAIMASLKVGSIAEVFPASAAHGMLAAIGVIIMSKQIHVALGVSPTGKEPLHLLAEIPASLGKLNPEIFLISLISFAILTGIPMIKKPWISRIPLPMVVIAAGILMGHLFDLEHQHKYLFLPEHEYNIGPKFLVTLPESFLAGFTMPNFNAYRIPGFFSVFVSLLVIQGLETLLSSAAASRFDDSKRPVNLNRDLLGVGLGSAISGLLGGLPIITEIVRSKANVANGAKTSWSNFFHGVFMLVFVAAFPGLIHQIPLACLATLLIVTGYRLASPSQFKHTWEIGSDQFIIFSATLIATLATDLLIGVATGVALKLFFHFVRGATLKNLFKVDCKIEYKVTSSNSSPNEKTAYVSLSNSLIFTNYRSFQKALESISQSIPVKLDFSRATLVDHTCMEKITHWLEQRNSYSKGNEVLMSNLVPMTNHPLAFRKRKESAQQNAS